MREHKLIINKLLEQMEQADMDALLLTSAEGVFYTSGCSLALLFRGRSQGCAVLTRDGQVYVICHEFDETGCDKKDPSVKVETFGGGQIYIEDVTKPGEKKGTAIDPLSALCMAFECIPPIGEGKKLGVETKCLTYPQAQLIFETYGKDIIANCEMVLNKAMMIKTPWEIQVLRRNARFSELAMHKTMAATVPGMTCAEIQAYFTKLCYEMAPNLTLVNHAHTFGSYFAPAWEPKQVPMQRGDLIRLDGGPTVDGYKSDLGRTYAVGGYADKERHEIYRELWKGYQWGVEHIGPGVKMCDFFNGINEQIKIPGYTRGHYGHSIGCHNGEEYPFFSPNEPMCFQPGMVVCIETPFYSARRHTYNIEDTFVITENGAEQVTHANPSLYV